MVGGPGFFAVLLKRTNASSIKLLSGSERFSGTKSVPNSASTFSFLPFSKVYGLILRVPDFGCALIGAVNNRKIIANQTQLELDIRDASLSRRSLRSSAVSALSSVLNAETAEIRRD